jgi:hypothetical protein
VARLKRKRLDSAPFPCLIAHSSPWEGLFESMIDLRVIKLTDARWMREQTTQGKESTFFFAHQHLTNAFSQPRRDGGKNCEKSSSTERLDELRALNRKTFEETGEYMTEEEIRAFRQPRWTDRREFQDDD